MDPQTILIGITAFVVSALLIYLISAFTMREKTFEEVMAEQKKRQEEEREKAKLDKKLEKELYKKKFKKGKNDKSKEKSAQVSEPELKKERKISETEPKKMVNLEIEPEIIEPVEAVTLGSKKSKPARKKPILTNKDETIPVAEKAPELPHKPVVPRDEVELKKLHEKETHVSHMTSQADTLLKKETKVIRQQVEIKKEVKETVKEVKVQKLKSTRTEVAPRAETPEVQNTAALPEPERRITKAKIGSGEPEASSSHLIDSVRSAQLSDKDVQALIELLLNRQGAAGSGLDSWNKKSQKGDPVVLMKKQLEEKEKALQEEQQLAMSANARLKEVHNELSHERSKFSSIEKHLQEKITAQAAELEALQARMRHAHEQHMREVSDMRVRMQQLEQSGDAALVQKLKQENKILQDSLAQTAKESVPLTEVSSLKHKMAILEKELSNNAIKLNSSESSKKSLEQKLHKFEEQIKNLEGVQKSSEEVMGKKLEEVNGELRKSEAKNVGLTADLKKAKSALSSAQAECTSVKTKLQELEKHLSSVDLQKEIEAKLQESERKKSELEGNVKNLEKQLTDAIRRQDELSSELQKVVQENYALAEEMKVTKERQQGEGQEAPAPPAGAPNGDVHKETIDKNVILVEEHERCLSEKNIEISRLLKELETQKSLSSNLQAAVDNDSVQLKELKEQLEHQKQKNDELRGKNWKAMEALEKAEKSATEKVDKSLKANRDAVNKAISDVELQDKGVLQRLFPDVSVSDKLGYKEWIVAFEEQATQYLSKVSSTEHTEIGCVKELEEENRKLQQQTESYEQNYKQLRLESDHLKELEEENKKLQQQVESYEKNSKQAEDNIEKLNHLEDENSRLSADLEVFKNNITILVTMFLAWLILFCLACLL